MARERYYAPTIRARRDAWHEFFPAAIPPAQVAVQVDVPSGTAPEFTDEIAARRASSTR